MFANKFEFTPGHSYWEYVCLHKNISKLLPEGFESEESFGVSITIEEGTPGYQHYTLGSIGNDRHKSASCLEVTGCFIQVDFTDIYVLNAFSVSGNNDGGYYTQKALIFHTMDRNSGWNPHLSDTGELIVKFVS